MMSTEPSDSVSETELGKSEFKGSDLRQDDTRDDPQQQIPAPLGVELRRYRRLTTGVILGLAMPKAVYLYKGEGPILTTLDLVAGIILAFLYAYRDARIHVELMMAQTVLARGHRSPTPRVVLTFLPGRSGTSHPENSTSSRSTSLALLSAISDTEYDPTKGYAGW